MNYFNNSITHDYFNNVIKYDYFNNLTPRQYFTNIYQTRKIKNDTFVDCCMVKFNKYEAGLNFINNPRLTKANRDKALRYCLKLYNDKQEDISNFNEFDHDNYDDTLCAWCKYKLKPLVKDKPGCDYFYCNMCPGMTEIDWIELICEDCSNKHNRCKRCKVLLI